VVSDRHVRRHPRRHAPSRRGWALVDVIVGGIILAIGLATVVSIAERSLAMQQRAERELVAAELVDGLLAEVLSVGVAEWELTRATTGAFAFEVPLEPDGVATAVCTWRYGFAGAIARADRDGAEFRVETLMAARPENTEEPQRAPTTPIDRQARYDEDR